MAELRFCANGCKVAGDRIPIEPPTRICERCEGRIDHWLKQIPEHYALLPTFIEHGTVDRNPDSQATKRAEAPAPLRLEVIDLLDTRLGRIWNGLAPAHDRRGVIGTLRVYVERVIEERPLTLTWTDTSVSKACDILRRHHLWVAEQEWVTEFYTELKKLHRDLADAIGEYRAHPVGRCDEDTDDGECGGPLFANAVGGVRCARCEATWDAAQLRRLGLRLAIQESA